MSASVSSVDLREEVTELIRIPSPSRKEGPVAAHCLTKLRDCGFEVEEDHAGNVRAHRGEPPFLLLNAHMDTVQDYDDVVAIRSGGLERPRLDLNYGFDDKAGIAIILTLARILELPFKVLLTTCEEIGGLGAQEVQASFYDDVICCCTLDRGGYDDIITSVYGHHLLPLHCLDEPEVWPARMDAALKRGGFVYHPHDGRGCDAVAISDHVPAFNFSVGIYERHSKYEWLNVHQCQRTAKAMRWLIENRGLLTEGTESPPTA